MWVRSLSREAPLEEGMGIHSSILDWRIPWTEESGRLQSMGSQRVRHDWATNTTTTHICSFNLGSPKKSLREGLHTVVSLGRDSRRQEEGTESLPLATGSIPRGSPGNPRASLPGSSPKSWGISVCSMSVHTMSQDLSSVFLNEIQYTQH